MQKRAALSPHHLYFFADFDPSVLITIDYSTGVDIDEEFLFPYRMEFFVLAFHQ